MGIITLTPKERNKFIGWLQQEVESDRILIQQIKKLPVGSAGVEVLEKIMMEELAGAIVVCKKLLNTEEQIIEPLDEGGE